MKEKLDARGDRALRAVQKMLDVLESKIDGDVKCSVADFIRLLQLERELKAEHVKEIQVTWQETKRSDN
jgi:FtsZ-binding cell division protein ZapB